MGTSCDVSSSPPPPPPPHPIMNLSDREPGEETHLIF